MPVRSMDISEDPERRRSKSKKLKLLISGAIIILIILLCVGLYFLLKGENSEEPKLVPDDPEIALPPSKSFYHIFKRAAVCSDGPPCAEIGRNILLRNGSAVDAAIATMVCNGMVNMQSMGFGGGFLMTIYNRTSKETIVLNSREKAPIAAHDDMYEKNPKDSSFGPLSIGVPGEVRGYWIAHKRFGALPWNELFTPSIKMCKTGFNMTDVLWQAVTETKSVKIDPQLRKMYIDEETGEFKKGLIKPNKEFCNTLEIIAEKGGDELYVGELSKAFIQDLQDAGSIITQEDLRLYEPNWSEPFKMALNRDDTFYSAPPPGSGAIVGLILRVLSQYNFNENSIANINNTITTYHRIIETFKHAYAQRSHLGDPKFIDSKLLIQNFTTPEFIRIIRNAINDSAAINDPEYYGGSYYKPDHGTAHVSIIAPNGDAVSVTSTINYYFGSGVTTRRTGIIMNNCMDDFSAKGFSNYFAVPPSPANFIQSQKRPLSSMSPSIITDGNGDVKMVIGASGGTKIISAVALVIMRNLWFQQTIKESVDAPRIHHQLYPMQMEYEYGNLKPVIRGLHELGHKTVRYRERGSIICALFKNGTAIYANSDHRKGGDVHGFN